MLIYMQVNISLVIPVLPAYFLKTMSAVTCTLAYNNEVFGQFDTCADATVINLLISLHDYKAYDRNFKCLVRLTGAIGSKNEAYLLS